MISTSLLALYGVVALLAAGISFLLWAFYHLWVEARRQGRRAARLEKVWPRR